MSKQSKQMEGMSVDDIKANPCGFCFACDWEKEHGCYEGNPAQCSICGLLLQLIDKIEGNTQELTHTSWGDNLQFDTIGKVRIDGQEWYDRFKSNLGGDNNLNRQGMEWLPTIKAAAEKAAGIDTANKGETE